jgi:hypothetical protein
MTVAACHSTAAPVAPNARRQPLLEAGAQRTLEAVGCTPWFGAESRKGPDLLTPPLSQSRPVPLRLPPSPHGP